MQYSIVVWDIRTGTMLHKLEGLSNVLGLSGTVAASVGKPGSISLWNINTGQPMCTIPNIAKSQCALTPDGTRLMTVMNQNAMATTDMQDIRDDVTDISDIVVWDTHTGNRLRTIVVPKD